MDSSADFATPRVAAGALFRNARDEVFLVHPTYKDTWDIPGGYVERGESPAAACRRELREEIGLGLPVRRQLTVDWAPSDSEGDKLLFVFDCGPLVDTEVVLDGVELDRWQWVAPADFDAFLIPRLARRLRAAPSASYLEHGQPL
ncbi:MAG TPA: NUDIX hydrolase [Pseudonocardiaceae bacterium]|jgi:8-oxo-dGTP pyrophosphatase MutT (NUDIX family)|nr:NUDIX hydrolase [Pseudonocardiaceae bacterium]